MTFWSDQSASRIPDRKRIVRLLEDRAGFDVAATDAMQQGDDAFLTVELHEKTAAQVLVERYDVKLPLEVGFADLQARVDRLESSTH